MNTIENENVDIVTFYAVFKLPRYRKGVVLTSRLILLADKNYQNSLKKCISRNIPEVGVFECVRYPNVSPTLPLSIFENF